MATVTLTPDMGKALLKSRPSTDFTIYVQDESFRVHRNVLANAFTMFDHLPYDLSQFAFTFQHTTALAVAQLLFWAYTGDTALDLDDIYETWPHLRPDDHVSVMEHQAEVNQTQDPSEQLELEAEFIPIAHKYLTVNVGACIQLYKLTHCLGMERVKEQAAEYVLSKIEGSLRGDDPEDDYYRKVLLTEQEAAATLVSIYASVTEDLSEERPLRTKAMVLCIQYADRIRPDDAPAKVFKTTILEHPEMKADWDIGSAVAKLVRPEFMQDCDLGLAVAEMVRSELLKEEQ